MVTDQRAQEGWAWRPLTGCLERNVGTQFAFARLTQPQRRPFKAALWLQAKQVGLDYCYVITHTAGRQVSYVSLPVLVDGAGPVKACSLMCF